MKMKKIVSAALAMAMALSLAACGGQNNGGQSTTPPPSCLVYTSPRPRDHRQARLPASA